jgi:hypothetical protein
MKKLAVGVAVGFLFANTIISTKAGLMDESDCLKGPFALNHDVSSVINRLDSRLVACVNYLQTKQIDNHNRLAEAISTLELRLSTLEGKVSSLENR